MSYPDTRAANYPPSPETVGESRYPPPPGEGDERAKAYYHQPQRTMLTLPSIFPYNNNLTYSNSNSNSNNSNTPYLQPHSRPYYSPVHHADPYGASPQAAFQASYPDARVYPQPAHGQPPTPPHSDSWARSPPEAPTRTSGATRQRTSIACRYCRRRKIRCSGFDTSPEGRCYNCVRFRQECMFTPVNANATAFVPASLVRGPHGAVPAGTPLYGAHGQRLPQDPQVAQLPPYTAAGGPPFYGHTPPAPTGWMYNPSALSNGTSAYYAQFERPGDVNGANHSPESTTSSQYLLLGQPGPSMSRTPPPAKGSRSPGDDKQDPMALKSIMGPSSGPNTAQIDDDMRARLKYALP